MKVKLLIDAKTIAQKVELENVEEIYVERGMVNILLKNDEVMMFNQKIVEHLHTTGE